MLLRASESVSAGIETTKKSNQEMTIYKTTTQEKQREQGLHANLFRGNFHAYDENIFHL